MEKRRKAHSIIAERSANHEEMKVSDVMEPVSEVDEVLEEEVKQVVLLLQSEETF